LEEPTTEGGIEEAARLGAEACIDVLKNGKVDDGSMSLARLGMTAISNYVKLRQSSSSREATLVALMHRSAEDETEFRRLVVSALPSNPVALALQEPVPSSP